MGIQDNSVYKGVTKFFKSLLCERVRLVVCSVIVLLLIVIDCIGIANGWMVLDVHPVLAFFLLVGSLMLLAMVEALHYSCVAMERLDMSHMKKSHPTATACQELVNSADKVKRFLNGRQFFVIFVVFLIAQLTNFPGFPKDFGGFSEGFNYFLSKSGIPGVALVLTVGQLISQLYVEEYMLLFMDKVPFCYSMIQLCFAVEWIGTTHFAWALYEGSSRLFCMKVRRKAKDMDEVMSPTQEARGPDFDLGIPEEENMSLWTAFRYLWSTFVCVASIVILCYGIANEHYILHAPAAVAFIIAACGLILLFYLEGLMIAIAQTQYWDREAFKEAYPRAYAVHEIVTQPDNLKRFIIGRQFMTVLTGFMLAEVFTFAYWENDEFEPTAFWIIVKSGLVGVLIVLRYVFVCVLVCMCLC